MDCPTCEKGDYILAYDEYAQLELEANEAGSYFLHFVVHQELTDRKLKRKKMREWLDTWETVKYYLLKKNIVEIYTLVPTDDKRAIRLQSMFGFTALINFDNKVIMFKQEI